MERLIVIKITDRGKYAINNIFSFASVFYLFVIFFCCTISYLCFIFSPSAKIQKISEMFSASSALSPTNSLTVLATEFSNNSLSNFSSLFNISQDLNLTNKNRENYRCYSGFFAGNNLFGSHYAYMCSDLFGDCELSVFPSPVNTFKDFGDGLFSHEIWNVHAMFEGKATTSVDGTDSENFCFIPQNAANYFLSKQGILNPTVVDYKSLLGRTISITFVDKQHNISKELLWCIGNIIFEDEEYTYFSSRYGLSIFTYTSLPSYRYASLSFDLGHSPFAIKDFLSKFLNQYNFDLNKFCCTLSNKMPDDLIINDNNIESALSSFNKFSTQSSFNYYFSYVCVVSLVLAFQSFACHTKLTFSNYVIVCFIGLLLFRLLLILASYSLNISIVSIGSVFSILSIVLLIISYFIKSKFTFKDGLFLLKRIQCDTIKI